MYLDNIHRYYVGNEQHCQRGRFLLMLCKDNEYRAVVRKVALRQLGPWMMGTAMVHGYSLTVSGSYGNDGLPVDCDTDAQYGAAYVTSSVGVKDEGASIRKKMALDKLWQESVAIPAELIAAWIDGGGHNGAGTERDAMREWARLAFYTGKPKSTVNLPTFVTR